MRSDRSATLMVTSAWQRRRQALSSKAAALSRPPSALPLIPPGMGLAMGRGNIFDVRWDDLELLRLVDQLEQGGTGNLHSGFALMEYAAQAKGHQLDYTNDPRPFAHELLVAREADLLKFDDRMYPGMAQADPVHNAHTWLQQIRDIELTFEGRRLARSQVFIGPLPNPDEDDGRPINALTLEEIARHVGDTYNERQLPKFFKDSGVPEELGKL